MSRETRCIRNWIFQIGKDESCLRDGCKVTVPHTWNIEAGREDVTGTGWYRHTWTVPEEWKEKRVRVKFHAVYHEAVVYVNGVQAGEHRHSGYTPFVLDVTGYLKYGETNELTVQVNNEYSEKLLPHMRSFDWANDGGLIRDVELIVTGQTFIKDLKTEAKPVLTSNNSRQDAGHAVFGFDLALGGDVNPAALQLEWTLRQGQKEILCGQSDCAEPLVSVERKVLENVSYWHFDAPELYELSLCLRYDGEVADTLETNIGFRTLRVEGSRIYFNGEPVRLCGTEWMPGSDPAFGSAETKEQLEKMLIRLKESNCVFTRFHWQQDDFVYDWCDRHGMLVQEEIPYWGRNPALAGDTQLEIFKQQAEEMITAHRNHPSIIAWGVGNELNAQAEETIQYIKDALVFTRALDHDRTANYVSNSFYEDPKHDGTIYGDMMMINEYTGTWMPDREAHEEISRLLQMNPDKPLIPSEFGLCEPAFSGGDVRRAELFLEKMAIYRCYPRIAGTINFCLNDYRTQMGEAGEGKLRCRIHGSTELDGTPKPSYFTVQSECAPFLLQWVQDVVTLTCRADLPCYKMSGYTAHLRDIEGKVLARISIPNLEPGQTWTCRPANGSEIAIYRRNGDCAGVYGK